MNKVCFTGSIKEISDLSKNKYGNDTVRFTLSVKDDSGKITEPSITAYGEAAREIYGRLKEGNLIYFEGTYNTGKYGGYIVPVRIEKMLGNRREPEGIPIPQEKTDSVIISADQG